MTLVAWIFSLAAPLAINILIGVGVGTVTFAGLNILLDAVVSNITLSFQNVPVNLLVFLDMSGVLDAVSITLGALTAKLLLASLSKFRLANP